MALITPPESPVWNRRLAIGIPIVTLVLVFTSMNLIGGILISRDLRAEDARLSARLEQAEAGDGAATSTAPAERPKVSGTLELGEFAITSSLSEVPAWAEVTLEVTNTGTIPHDAKAGDTGTAMLEPGQTETITVNAPGSGTLTLICTVAGHEAAGMKVEIPVTGGAAGDASGDGVATAAAASPDNADAYDGAKPALELRDPAAPPRPAGSVHDITFTVEEKVMQVAENVWQEVWTFNGQAPGPTIRVKVGDTVNLRLVNPDSAKVAHSIDFHASMVAWNDEMRSLNPGEELMYTFEATRAGVFMYHCGTAPALHHIGNGMHGMIIVEPATPLPAVDREFVFVQHEYYLGPQGQPGDLAKMAKTAAEPDLVVFNGVAGQYATHPIEVGVGERVRAWVLNAGPSADSSFHVVGTIFDTVMKEGVELRRDNAAKWGAQAMDLAPAQGGFVEFTLPEDGLYPIVTHAFNHVGAGALGLFKAGTGGEAATGGH